MNRYALRDDQWERIKDLLPGKPGDVGVTARDNSPIRRSGALPLPHRNSVARSAGTVWRLEEHAQAVQPWANKGVWQRLFEHLTTDADNEYAMIDSTIVRAHQHSAGAPKKR